MRRTIAVAVLAVLTLSACAPDPAEHVVTMIKATGSDLVREIDYRPANFLDPAEVVVYLRAGATAAQAGALWCAVIVPAAGGPDASASLVTLWDDAGNTLLSEGLTCPPTGTS